MSRVFVIAGSDRFNQVMVGRLVRPFHVMCQGCHKQKILFGRSRAVRKKLKALGWFEERDLWFCPRHTLEDLSYLSDPDRFDEKCRCEEVMWLGHAHDCPTQRRNYE